MRIGSLCTGYGGLDIAAESHFGASVAWVADPDPGASALLAHRFPDIPNLGDITPVDWSKQERVDIITAGFPCQDISNAGKREGIKNGNRSGLWFEVLRAVREIRPRYAFLENVGVITRRGLDIVLSSLSEERYNARWCRIRASDVGAPHRRERWFCVAEDANFEPGLKRWQPTPGQTEGRGTRPDAGGRGRVPSSDTPHIGRERPRVARGGRNGSKDSGNAAADPQSDRRDERRTESTRQQGGQSLAVRRDQYGKYAEAVVRWELTTGHPPPQPTALNSRGDYRLSPLFVEWMMGLPPGHVTDVSGLTRNQQLKLLGNGVVPQQAAEALRILTTE